MHSDVAQGLVAEFLTSPTLLLETLSAQRRITSCERLAHPYANEGEEFDQRTLEQLRSFQSFIAMVRHNPIIPLMPRTFAVLKALEIELRFFNDLTPEYMKGRVAAKLSLDQQVDLIAKTAVRFASLTGHHSLGAVARHEQLVQQSRRSPASAEHNSKHRFFMVDEPLRQSSNTILGVYQLDIMAVLMAVDKSRLRILKRPKLIRSGFYTVTTIKLTKTTSSYLIGLC